MLKVGVLYRIGSALDYLSSHPLSEEQFLNSFGNWEGVAGTSIIETCKKLGWITAKSTDELLITPSGRALCETRNAPARLRLQLEHILSFTRPTWAALAVRGRNAVASYAPPEAVQCLSDASLLDGTDQEVVAWWDRLAAYYRNVRDGEKMVTGRVGERASFDQELRRTRVPPVWVALETNDAGYDLISRVDADFSTKLLVEVKTSTLPWEDAEAFLSRHEWNVLSLSKAACLHLWSIDSKPYQFRRANIDELRAFVPVDLGEAQWLTLSLPFRIFGPPVADG